MIEPKLDSGKTSTLYISLDRITLAGVKIGISKTVKSSGGLSDALDGWSYVLPITSLTSKENGGSTSTYGDIPMNGDVIECKIDRSAGKLSFRTFRDGRWKDDGEAYTDSSFNSGDLQFAVSVFQTGDTLSIAGTPIGK